MTRLHCTTVLCLPAIRKTAPRGLLATFFIVLLSFPSLIWGAAFISAATSIAPPPEPWKQQHTPPRNLTVYGKSYDLTRLENPVRMEVLSQLKSDPEQAMVVYTLAITAGKNIYYSECMHCHGDHLDGVGMFAGGLNPAPPDFRQPGSLGKLREAHVFWRITIGGAGLPKENAPWASAMPDYQNILSEEEVWNLILFLYDRVGQAPSLPDAASAEASQALNKKRQDQRAGLNGEELYQFYCTVCHGENGAGDGVAAKFLYPAPRDFTIGIFKYKTSPADTEQPSDEDLFKTIKFGLPRTGMPPWGVVLDDDQIRSLLTVVKALDTVGTWAPLDAEDEEFDDDGHYTGEMLSFVERISWENQVPFTKASVAQGKEGFIENCTPCHGDDGRGNPAVEKNLRDDWGARIWPRDLTKPWTWRVTNVEDSAEQTIRNIFTRLSVGILGTPMPEHTSGVSEELRWHIANYEFTLRNTSPTLTTSRVIQAVRVAGPLPDSVNDSAWADVPPTLTLLMLPNVSKGARLFKPLNDAVSVRVLYNDQEIGFLLEMDDRTRSLPGDADAETMQDPDLTLYSDAFAIQFPKTDAFSITPTVEKPLPSHGDAAHATTIWYWNAGSVDPELPAHTSILDASGVDQKLQPRQGDTGLEASGEWVNGRWRIMIKQRRNNGVATDIKFNENQFIPVSFGNWDGSNGEIGSKHMLSPWYWLVLAGSDKDLAATGTY